MWKIQIAERVQKQFAKLDFSSQQQIIKFLNKVLEHDDPTVFAKPLVGDLSGFWRFRVGKFRLIADIQKRYLIIEIIRVDKRDKVYK